MSKSITYRGQVFTEVDVKTMQDLLGRIRTPLQGEVFMSGGSNGHKYLCADPARVNSITPGTDSSFPIAGVDLTTGSIYRFTGEGLTVLDKPSCTLS